MHEPEKNETPLGRYFIWFTMCLLVVIILLLGLRATLQLDAYGLFMIAPFLAAIVAADRFVRSERRAPSQQERKQLTFGNLGITLFAAGFMALAAVSSGALFAYAEQAEVPINVILILSISIILSALVLNYLLIRWAYGSIAHKRAGRLSE